MNGTDEEIDTAEVEKDWRLAIRIAFRMKDGLRKQLDGTLNSGMKYKT